MKNKPLVSVIVPVYKAENYLYRCVESIRKQTYSKLQIILIDNGSPDKCPEICENFAKLDSRIKVIHKEYGSISSARNAGLDVMTGSYVAFIHCEDFIYKDYLKTLIFLCLKYKTDIAACGVCYGNGSSFHRVSKNGKIYVYNNKDAFMSRKIKSGLAGKLYRTTLFANERFPVKEQVSENKQFNFSEESLTYKLIYKSYLVTCIDKKCIIVFIIHLTQIKSRNHLMYRYLPIF
ncbi:glycosyltransferase [Anaerocolumna sedimenticola]|uniref:Glycosyltransferase n=1 Tax=Anaerocolumna sedimenticola TaxID=2696063 RepID=A0A6P1TM83_9FIRM|nr:glycosyltransferase [Anaerocolumna sedimenticola]QHQ62330.1 glycosyltransferase [Anaerocolumna sedimenticola]